VITQRNYNLKKAINRREKRMHAEKTCTYIKKLITLWVKGHGREPETLMPVFRVVRCYISIENIPQ